MLYPAKSTSLDLSAARQIMCAVGDDPESLLLDSSSGKIIGGLKGHLDYSFAAAWHPGGHVLATGNQDTTTRLWDIRFMDSAFATLKGRIGAVRAELEIMHSSAV